MKTVLWNIDSLDWKDPFPESIAQRVLREARRNRGGIILLQDIQRRTVAALPLMIELLQKDGFTFLRWNGSEFVAAPAQGPVSMQP